MTRKISLDDAGLLLLRLDADRPDQAAELVAVLLKLSKQRTRPAAARTRLAEAAAALQAWAESGGDGSVALEAASMAVEYGDREELPRMPPKPAPEPAPEPAPGAEAAAATSPADPMAAAAAAMLAEFDREEEPVIAVDADPELLEAFVAESMELLQAAEATLLELEHDPHDKERLNTVFRSFHTIKGTSSFLGLDHIGRLAHRAESLLALARDGKLLLTGTHADLVLKATDLLGGCITAAGTRTHAPGGMEALLQALDAAVQSPQTAPSAEAVAAPVAESAGAEQAEVRPREGDTQDAWVRVRTDRLDRLVEMVGELVIAHAMIAQDPNVAAQHHDGLNRKVGHSGKIVRELQDLSISMRMVPLKPLFQRLARVARDAAQRTGKRVNFVVRGEDTELDRTMVETLSDPLVHMIRNAVDHGIEEPAERLRLGKTAEGRIEVAAFHAGGNLVVELSDDGRGLNRDAILEKAIRQGLAERDRYYADTDVFELIFGAGFSTAAQVTALSGRGVGMDVVRRGVESLRGRIEIRSALGAGSTFGIRLPLTLAITDGMLVRVGEERFILPTINIQLSFRPTAEQVSTVTGRGELVLLRDELLPVLRLHSVFGSTGIHRAPEEALLVVVGAGERRCALLVDELLGQQQVVAKTLGNGIGKIQGVSGGAILGDGRVGLILDVGELMGLARERAA